MVDYNAYLVPGVLIAFLAGILQPWLTRTGAFACILAGPILSVVFERGAKYFYAHELQVFHRTGLAAAASYLVLVVVSLIFRKERDAEREQYV